MPDPVGDLGSADIADLLEREAKARICLLYTSPSPRDPE